MATETDKVAYKLGETLAKLSQANKAKSRLLAALAEIDAWTRDGMLKHDDAPRIIRSIIQEATRSVME